MTRISNRRSSSSIVHTYAIAGLFACGLAWHSGRGQASYDEPIRLALGDRASTTEQTAPPVNDEQAAREKREEEEARAAKKARIRASLAESSAERAARRAERDAQTPEERRAAFQAKVEEMRRRMEAMRQQAESVSPPRFNRSQAKAPPTTNTAQPVPPEPSPTAQPVIPPPAYSADDNEIASRSLAVLTSRDLQSAGYSDLLTAMLTEQLAEYLELVERDAIEEVIGEYQISELFGGANAVEQRISLGHLLRADVLLLLSRQASEPAKGESARSIRWLMVDTRTGARLALDVLPDANGIEQTTNAILAKVNDVLHRYPHGVERIVGVSHFLSRCLTHAYDGYQTSCAAILSEALSLQRGVAVLEIEEARAIGDELAITLTEEEKTGDGNTLHRRVVPILVSGEFRVTQKGASEQFQITASIQRTSKTPESVGAASLDSAGLRTFLSETLPRRVLGEGREVGLFQASGHAVDSQFAWLCAEAERFDRIGLWEQAAGLREAALLLKPADIEVRHKVILDYRRQMMRRFPLPKRVADMPSEEEIRKEYRSRIPFYNLMVAHMEYMIRNRLIFKEDIVDGTPYTRALPMRENRLSPIDFRAAACESCIPGRLPFEEYDSNHRNSLLGKRLADIGHEEFAVCHETEKYFLEEVFPLIRDLPTEHPREASIHFASERIELLISPICYRHLSEVERFAQIEDALTRDMPRGLKLNRDFLHYIGNRVSGSPNKWREAKKEGKDPDEAVQADPWYQLLGRLSKSSRRDVQFYGKLGLALIDAELWHAKWRWACGEFQAEAREMGLEIIGQYGPVLAEKRPEFAQELAAIEQTLNELTKWSEPNDPLFERGLRMAASPLNLIERTRTHQLTKPEARPKRAPHLVRPAFRPGPQHWPRFQLTDPIPFMVKTLDGQHRPVIDDYWPRLHRRWDPNYRWSINTKYYPVVCWRKCTSRMDVLFSDWAILVMKTKGRAEEIHSDHEAHYLDVRWDGENFWVVTKNKGLWIMSTDGEILRTIGRSDGLPPYDVRVVLKPFAPGKATMVGVFDSPIRSWCAMIDTSAEHCVNVFHEATTRHDRQPLRDLTQTLQYAFMPKYIISHKTSEEGPAYFLVAREDYLPPMLINGETLEVSEPARVKRNPTAYEWDALNWNNHRWDRHVTDCPFHSLPGDRLLIPKCRIYQKYHSKERPPVVEIWQSPFQNLDKKIEYTTHCIGATGRFVLPVRKWLYVAGDPMIRIDPETLTEEKVYKDPGSVKTGGTFWQPSAHYGIVFAQNRNDKMQHILPFRQIKILEKPAVE